VGNAPRIGQNRNVYRILIGKPALRKPRYRWDYVIMDLRETEWEGVDWNQQF
jgi:hypothetical protein